MHCLGSGPRRMRANPTGHPMVLFGYVQRWVRCRGPLRLSLRCRGREVYLIRGVDAPREVVRIDNAVLDRVAVPSCCPVMDPVTIDPGYRPWKVG